MKDKVEIGLNRTGIQMAPMLTKKMQEGSKRLSPREVDEAVIEDIHSLRAIYAEASGALGTVPVPGTFKGMAKMVADKLTGVNAELLIDKLGERLAFERTGFRLYEALIDKCEASELDLPLSRLEEIRDEELSHFQMLKAVIEDLGADPTAQTPCADATAVACMGILQSVQDPRTSVPQALNAVLSAELTDTAGWDLLADLVKQAGLDDLADQFLYAHQRESEHVETIRGLLKEQLTLQL